MGKQQVPDTAGSKTPAFIEALRVALEADGFTTASAHLAVVAAVSKRFPATLED